MVLFIVGFMYGNISNRMRVTFEFNLYIIYKIGLAFGE